MSDSSFERFHKAKLRHGDKVEFFDSRGETRKGRLVMKSAAGGWVVNTGGRFGTTALVDDTNFKRKIGNKKSRLRSMT